MTSKLGAKMLSARGWMLSVLLPLVATMGVDQCAKLWAKNSLADPFVWGPFQFVLANNSGFLLGSLGDLSELYTIVIPSTVGGLLYFVFMVLQYFLPLQSLVLRTGLSIFAGGVFSNILDRIIYGYVIDFVQFNALGVRTGVLNIADALQWLGVFTFIASYIANGRLLFPADQRRGKKWIDPDFQLRFCLMFLAVGAAFALVNGLLSYTFLKFLVGGTSFVMPADAEAFIREYLKVFGLSTICFFILIFIVGVYMSHRIIGPIRGFENFLNGLVNGDGAKLRLRSTDEFKHLESIADRFYNQFHERMGIDYSPLEKGSPMPRFEAITCKRTGVSSNDLRGSKVWMMFYRYATCPLCALHLRDIKQVVEDVTRLGVKVVAVYESTPEQFRNKDAGSTTALLASMDIMMIADPERKLYRAFKTRTSILGLVRPSLWLKFWEAKKANFLQAKIDGKISQLPAHFLIDANGVIEHAFYGKSYIDSVDLNVVKEFAARNNS